MSKSPSIVEINRDGFVIDIPEDSAFRTYRYYTFDSGRGRRLKTLRQFLKQLLCDHEWSKYRGFYEEPAKGAYCLKMCGKIAK